MKRECGEEILSDRRIRSCPRNCRPQAKCDFFPLILSGKKPGHWECSREGLTTRDRAVSQETCRAHFGVSDRTGCSGSSVDAFCRMQILAPLPLPREQRRGKMATQTVATAHAKPAGSNSTPKVTR